MRLAIAFVLSLGLLQEANAQIIYPTASLDAPTHNPFFSGNFVSIQLRRLGGTNYEVNVFDRSGDTSSLLRCTIMDLDTNTQVFDRTYATTIGNYTTPGTFAEPVSITASNFSVQLQSREFSGSSVFFGPTGITVTNPPTNQLNDVTRNYRGPEPISALDAPTHNPFFGGNFVSIQLRRLGLTNYEVNVFDRSFDTSSLLRCTIMDLDTNTQVFDRTYATTIGNYTTPGTFAEPVSITASNFSVQLQSREFSGSSVFFGPTGITVTNPPTNQLNDVTRSYTCEGTASSTSVGTGCFGSVLSSNNAGPVSGFGWDMQLAGGLLTTDIVTVVVKLGPTLAPAPIPAASYPCAMSHLGFGPFAIMNFGTGSSSYNFMLTLPPIPGLIGLPMAAQGVGLDISNNQFFTSDALDGVLGC